VSTFDQFTALQNALSELNYSQPLLRESVPLVNAIFTDLIEVTKKYTHSRKQAEQTQRHLQSQIDPIKIENDRLTKSNNELHLKVIQNSDHFQAELKALEKECETLKLAKNEINVLLNQKKHKIKNQEMTINNLKKKMNAVLSARGSNNKRLITKTSKISFSSNLLSPASSKGGSDEAESKDTMEDDHERVLLLQHENATLLGQIKEVTAVSEQDKLTMAELEEKLKVREQEIQRIHSTLKIDDNRIQFLQHQQDKDQDAQKIRHLEAQIEVLQGEMTQKDADSKALKAKDSSIERLEEENRGLNDKLEVTWKEMDKLKLDLAAIRQTSKALKLEKKYDILKSTKKLSKNVNELTLMQNKIEELTKLNKVLETKLANKAKAHSILQDKAKDEHSTNHTMNVALEMKQKEVHKLRAEQVDLMKVADELKTRIKEMKHGMEINRNERENLEMTLKSAENKLAIVSKDHEDMVEKYESLKALNAKSQGSNKELTDDISNLLFRIKTLEKEKEAMNERLLQIMEQKNDFEKLESKKQSENFDLHKQLQQIQFKNEDLKKDKEWSDKSMLGKVARISKLEQEKKELNLTIERVHGDLDAMKRRFNEMEYKYNAQIQRSEELEDKLAASEQMLASLQMVKSNLDLEAKSKNQLELEVVRLSNENDKLQKESAVLENGDKRKSGIIAKIDREKNELKLILQQMQQRIVAFQQRLSAITADRDHLKAKYDEAVAAMDQKNEVIESGTLSLSDVKVECSKLQNEVRTLAQRNEELQAMFDGKDKLARESMSKIEQFTQIQERLSQQIREQLDEKKALQHSARELTKQRDELHSKLDSLRSEYNHLKENVVPALNQEVIVGQVQSGELKVLCNKLDDGQKSARQKIEDLFHQKQELTAILKEETAKMEEMKKALEGERTKHEQLRSALQKLVDKHDALQNELDDKCEAVQVLRGNVEQEKKRNEEFQSILSETQQQYRCQQKQMVEMAQKIKFAEELISKLQKKVIPELKEENRLKTEQLRHCEHDIQNMSKENQFLNNEYAVTINDRDSKGKQLSTALNKILYLESQVKSVQNERTQILENYKSVCLQNERLNQVSEVLDRSKSEYAVKIASLEEHIVRRDYRIKDLEKHLTECNLSNHELQRQTQSLTRDLQRSNLNNSKNQSLSENLHRDLEAMRSNVVQKQHSDLEKKSQIILEFKKENKNLQQIIQELNLEKEVALESLQSAEGKMERLEEIIRKLRVDHISNTEHTMKDADESNKLKRELNSMKDLNERLSQRLGKSMSSKND